MINVRGSSVHTCPSLCPLSYVGRTYTGREVGFPGVDLHFPHHHPAPEISRKATVHYPVIALGLQTFLALILLHYFPCRLYQVSGHYPRSRRERKNQHSSEHLPEGFPFFVTWSWLSLFHHSTHSSPEVKTFWTDIGLKHDVVRQMSSKVSANAWLLIKRII